MMINVEMAISHYNFITRYHIMPSCMKYGKNKEYYETMIKAITLEIASMVQETDNNMYNGVLSMYMRSHTLTGFVTNFFNTKEMLTPRVIHLAWSQGNVNIIQNCIELGVETDPCKNINCCIRSDCTNTVDMCVGLGASLAPPLVPYRHCRSVDMVRHLFIQYNCVLQDLKRKLPGNHLASVEYLYLGGYIEEMGDLNEVLRKQGNTERSLPIKKAYVGSKRKGARVDGYEGLGRFLMLPGYVVKCITEYI